MVVAFAIAIDANIAAGQRNCHAQLFNLVYEPKLNACHSHGIFHSHLCRPMTIREPNSYMALFRSIAPALLDKYASELISSSASLRTSVHLHEASFNATRIRFLLPLFCVPIS